MKNKKRQLTGSSEETPIDNDEMTDISVNVSRQEKKLLKEAGGPLDEQTRELRKSALDKTDGADQLNEGGDFLDMGEDLDVPGSELDDDSEELGEEDEENNTYSKPD